MAPARKAFVLRINDKTFSALKARAEKSHHSINSYCNILLESQLQNRWHSSENESLKKIKAYLGSKLVGILLFGSVARGTETTGSDVDLLIVLQDSEPIRGRLYREWDRQTEALDDRISPHFVHLPADERQSGSIWLEAAVEGKILFDPDHRIEPFLRKLRVLIAEGNFVRTYTYGVPYWKRMA